MKPREKLTIRGSESLSDIELVSAIVGSGSRGRSYEELAKSILKVVQRHNDKGRFVSINSLQSIAGVGLTTSSRIVASLELGRRFYDKSYRHTPKISSTAEARVYFEEIRLRKQEILMAAYINARFEIIAKETVAMGGVDGVGIHIRSIIHSALLHNAYGIVLAHNHPSGNQAPSQADISATSRLLKACEMFEIKLIDHIIIARDGFSSVPL